jgi:hypothetical protein
MQGEERRGARDRREKEIGEEGGDGMGILVVVIRKGGNKINFENRK